MVQAAPIFISHISEERVLASFLQARIQRNFLKAVNVFVSSDGTSILAGADWLQSLRIALDQSALVIVLCSTASIKQPWVNFEAGAAWLKKLPIVPLCHSGLEPGQLPMPLSLLQGGSIRKAETFFSLYERLAALTGLDVPEINFEEMAQDASAIVMEDPPQPGSEPTQILSGTLVRRALSGDVASMHELALSGAPETFETLTKVVMNSVNDQTRTEAISALGDLKDARTVEFLSGLIVKSKFPVTKACARVLGNIKDPAVIPVLIKTMRLAADWMSSQACVDALGEFAPQAPEEVCPALIEGLELGGFVADSARQALVQYNNAALPSLTAFLDDAISSPFALRQAIDVVGLIGDPSALNHLKAFRARVDSNPDKYGTSRDKYGTSRQELTQAVDSAARRLTTHNTPHPIRALSTTGGDQ